MKNYLLIGLVAVGLVSLVTLAIVMPKSDTSQSIVSARAMRDIASLAGVILLGLAMGMAVYIVLWLRQSSHRTGSFTDGFSGGLTPVRATPTPFPSDLRESGISSALPQTQFASSARTPKAVALQPVQPLAFVTGVEGAIKDQRIPILNQDFNIGRRSTNHLQLRDVSVSRLHARIIYRRGQFWLYDCSHQGIYVNGIRMTDPLVLSGNETILMGRTVLKFKLPGQ